MFTLLGKLMGGKVQETEPKEVKCLCGEPVDTIPNGSANIYLCKKCNKLIYHVDPSLLTPKVTPISLGWFKKKRR